MLFHEINLHQIYNFICNKTTNFKVFSNKNNILTFNELSTVCITSFVFFNGNYTKCLSYMIEYNLIPNISLSAFSKARTRVFGKIDDIIAITLAHFSTTNIAEFFMIDSFPVEACSASRQSSLFSEKSYTGFCAAKKLYYKGLKVMLITNNQGHIVQFEITHANQHDTYIAKHMDFSDIYPQKSVLYADKGFSSKDLEAKLLNDNIQLLACKKTNAKDYDKKKQREIINKRKKIETFINSLIQFSGRNVFKFNTIKGLIHKIKLMILSYNVVRLLS